jgi:hypothetical protein
MSSHFIMFYMLNKTKAYSLYNSGGFGYRWVDFRKSNTLVSTHLKSKKCDWQPDDPQRHARLTNFRIRLFGLNRFADFCPPLVQIIYFIFCPLSDRIWTNPKVEPQTEPIQTENCKNHICFECIWMTFLLNREPQKPRLTTKTGLSFYYIPIPLKPH